MRTAHYQSVAISMSTSFQDFWAKYDPVTGATYPAILHLLDSATAAIAVYQVWLRAGLQTRLNDCLGTESVKKLALIVASHDLGKINPVFQGQLAVKSDISSVGTQDDDQKPFTIQFAKSVLSNLDSSRFRRPEAGGAIARNSSIRRHEQVAALDFFECESGLSNLYASPNWLGLACLGHHGTFHVPRRTESTKDFRGGEWKNIRIAYRKILEQEIGVSYESLPADLSPIDTLLISGITIISDRLASGNDWVTQQQKVLGNIPFNHFLLDKWITTSYKRMERRVRRLLGTFVPLKDPWSTLFGKWKLRPAQLAVRDTGAGLLTIMAPTGSGKTEAALLRHHANGYQHERLIFLLPTQATSNAIMERFQLILKETGNIASLAHGMAVLEEFYNQPLEKAYIETDLVTDSLHPTDFVRQGSARLLAPICVGTVDQLAMAALPLKWTHLRLTALANAHIVIDEVHTLDAYQTELLKPILHWLGILGTRVTLLSATLADEQLKQLIGSYSEGEKTAIKPTVSIVPAPSFPSVLLTNKGSTKKQILTPEKRYQIDYQLDFEKEKNSYKHLAESHIQWHKQVRKRFPRARIGIFTNTIKNAQEIAFEIKKSGQKVIVLHSRMTAAHKSLVSANLTKFLGPGSTIQGLTVVGTQAIEASLDIDFDLISSDLAPAASLIQRAGRCWRRQDANRISRIPGVSNLFMHIASGTNFESEIFASWGFPYPRAAMLRTFEWLRNHRGSIEIPGQIQEFVDAAWVSCNTLESEADFESIAADGIKTMRAEYWTEPLTNLLGEDGITLTSFEKLTGPIGNKENAQGETPLTRFTDRPKAFVIACGSQANIPGATSREHLEKLINVPRKEWEVRDYHKALLDALKAEIPISASTVVRKIENNSDYTTQIDESAPTLLRGKYILDFDNTGTDSSRSLRYDSALGLIVNL